MLPACLIVALPVFAQPPAFEVATIKQVPQISVEDMLSGKVRPGVTTDASQVSVRAFSLSNVILRAYGGKPIRSQLSTTWTPSGSSA